MSMERENSLYAGLSGLELCDDPIDFGCGVLMRRTYAHLFSSMTLAFKEPTSADTHHQGPWVATSSGSAFDIRAELIIPSTFNHALNSQFKVARTIVSLLRLFVDPEIILTFISEHPISSLPDRFTTANSEMLGTAIEVHDRYFQLALVDRSRKLEHLDWVKKNWKTALDLRAHSAQFAFAIEVFEIGQFIPSSAMTLVSIWGALEGIFSVSQAELKFRVSSFIAAYMEPPGNGRLAHQKKIAKLYDKRCAAAHGTPKHEPNDVLASFELLRMVLIKIIENGKVPNKDDLERMLFSASAI